MKKLFLAFAFLAACSAQPDKVSTAALWPVDPNIVKYDENILNRGPVKTCTYSFYLKNGSDFKDLEAYAKMVPYGQGDILACFFYKDSAHAAHVVKALEVDETFDKYCVAGYWHWPAGKEEFAQWPLTK